MILTLPSEGISSPADRRFRGEYGDAATVESISVADHQPDAEFPEFNLAELRSEQGELQMREIPLAMELDWSDRKTLRAFIALEQKVLANKASQEEIRQYHEMKSDRDAEIFADRYVSDYAEIERVKILARKISEIQKYLRPIRTG